MCTYLLILLCLGAAAKDCSSKSLSVCNGALSVLNYQRRYGRLCPSHSPWRLGSLIWCLRLGLSSIQNQSPIGVLNFGSALRASFADRLHAYLMAPLHPTRATNHYVKGTLSRNTSRVKSYSPLLIQSPSNTGAIHGQGLHCTLRRTLLCQKGTGNDITDMPSYLTLFGRGCSPDRGQERADNYISPALSTGRNSDSQVRLVKGTTKLI